MKDPSAPEKGRGRPDDESDRTSRKPKSDGGTIPNPPTPVKRLLANWGTVWLFEVTFPTRSRIAPAAVLGTLAAYEVRFDIPIVYCTDPKAAALQVESYAYYFAREHVRAANQLLRAIDTRQPEGTAA